jgi:hypothetical protein
MPEPPEIFAIITTPDRGSGKYGHAYGQGAKRDARYAEAQRKMAILIECRLSGGSWEQCRRAAGYANSGTAYRRFHEYMEKLPMEGAARMRRVIQSRLDRLLTVVWPAAMAGAAAAVDRVLAIEAQRARVMGLEKEPPGGDTETDVEMLALARRYSGLTDQELEAEVRRLDWVVVPPGQEQEEAG